MAKTEFQVQPQRSDGRGYVPCELHRATSFAVIRTDRIRRAGKLYTASRVLARFATSNQAQLLADANTQSFLPSTAYRLGKRIIKKGS